MQDRLERILNAVQAIDYRPLDEGQVAGRTSIVFESFQRCRHQIQLAKRVTEVSPFLAMEIMERAKTLEAEGREIIYLCLGEPDFATPEPIVTTAREAMLAGETRYTHSLGRIELREALVDRVLA